MNCLGMLQLRRQRENKPCWNHQAESLLLEKEEALGKIDLIIPARTKTLE
jgi:hypothetical protein